MGLPVEFLGFPIDNGRVSFRTDLCQFGIFLDFDSPSLIFGQVPMKVVDVMQCHQVNHLLKVADREEVTTYIDHESPVTETGKVGNRTGRKGSCHLTVFQDRKSFMNSLDTIKDTGFTASRQKNLFRSDLKFITFRMPHCGVYSKNNSIAAFLFVRYTNLGSGHFFNKSSQKISSTMHLFIGCRVDNRSAAVNNKRSSVPGKDNLLRLRDYVQITLYGGCRAAGCE